MTAIQRSAQAANTGIVNRLAEVTNFNRDQIEIIKDTIAKGASDDELMVFMMLAHRTGLDPFSRQIYLIERSSNVGGEWKTTRQPMTGIDGLRLTADRTGNYAPGRAPTFEYDQDGNLFSATAYIWKFVRNDWREVSATAHYGEYAQMKKDGKPNKFWGEKPHIMLAKCAEALCLRRAFPADLSGLYTNDEIANDEPVIIHQAPPSPARAALPQPSPANPDTGEVIEPPMVSGTVSAVKISTNASGDTWVSFAVAGTALVAKAIDFPGIEYIEDGDYAQVTYQPTKGKGGKVTNKASMITGEDDADGFAPWEERAAEEGKTNGEDGATFTAIEAPEEEPV